MDIRVDTTNVINFLRTIEKQKKIIKELKLSFQEEKKKHSIELKKYKFVSYNKINRGISTRNKNQLQQNIKGVFRELNNDLNKIGFGIKGILNIVENNQSEFEIKFNANIPGYTRNEDECLYYKDKTNMTDKNYHLFRKGLKLNDRVNTLHSIKKRRKKRGLEMGIKPLDTGYYRNPVRMIKERIASYAKNLCQGEGLDLIKIKLGCDGTNVSRNVKLINFVFSVINEKVKAASVNGCYRIGIFRVEKEDYDSTKNWLPVLWDQIKGFKKVFYDTIEQKAYDQSELDNMCGERRENRFVELEIQYSFCSDMKMNLIVLGLKAANSKWPCMHCTVNKNNLNERGKQIKKINNLKNNLQALIFLINLGESRTVAQQIAIVQSAASEHLGYAHLPLTDIPYECTLMDILHKFLRVSDLLVEILLDDLFRLDQMYATTMYSTTSHRNISILSKYLEAECKLAPLKEGYTPKDIRSHMKSLQGPSKTVIFEKINSNGLKNIFRKLDKKYEITSLWKQYWFIHKKLRSDNTSKYNFIINYSSHFFENSCHNLLILFLECYGKERMTPYLHVTCVHLHEMHKLHGNLNYFCNEGLEKLNDLSTSSFFRSTNKRSTFIKQMLERDARLEKALSD